jgi:hypothetical protein
LRDVEDPYCLGNRLTHGGDVVSLMRRPRFSPRKIFLLLISIRGCFNPRANCGFLAVRRPL